MPHHRKGPGSDTGCSSVEMKERNGPPAVGHDFLETGLRRQPVTRTGHINPGCGEGRHQKMHHPSIEQKPETAVDGDEDRGAWFCLCCRKEIDPVTRVRTVAEIHPRAVGYLPAFLGKETLPVIDHGRVDRVCISGVELGSRPIVGVGEHRLSSPAQKSRQSHRSWRNEQLECSNSSASSASGTASLKLPNFLSMRSGAMSKAELPGRPLSGNDKGRCMHNSASFMSTARCSEIRVQHSQLATI